MRSILVATDGSALSAKALVRSIEMAKQFDAKLTVVNVVDVRPVREAVRYLEQVRLPGSEVLGLAPMPLTFPAAYDLNALDSLDLLDNQSRALAQRVSDYILAGALQAAQSAGLADVHTVSASGDPAKQIVATAEAIGADLVVLGRRGLTGLTELVLGSVSQKVLLHAPVDVFVAS